MCGFTSLIMTWYNAGMIQQSDSEILSRLLELEGTRLSPEKAQMVLSVALSPEDVERLEELGERSNEGTLTEAEREQYASYVRVLDLLAILQARARITLKKLGKTA